MKDLSIIIPHFNSPKGLVRLLKSIPNKPWISVYVIDDHSDPQFLSEIESIQSLFDWCHFSSVPPGKKGPGIARNIGIDMSQSNWVLFADSDDYFVEGAFEHIESYLQGEQDAIYFAPDSINEDSMQPTQRHEQYKKLVMEFLKSHDKILFYRFFVPWSKLISLELLKKNNIRFDDGVGGEDNNFSLKVAYFSESVSADSQTVYCVTESNNSLTRTFSKKVLENHFKALSRYNDFLQSKGLSEYQVPMLGWVVRARKINLSTMFQWLIICIRKGYPLKPFSYIQLFK